MSLKSRIRKARQRAQEEAERKRAVYVDACQCGERTKPVCERAWEVWDRYCNYSAFSGYRRTPSDYSCVHCRACGRIWRTRAKYVGSLRNRRP